MTKSSLRRAGFAWGKYVADYLFWLIKSEHDAGNLTEVVSDNAGSKVLAYWNRTIDDLRSHLSPKEIEIFEDAANEARAAKSKIHVARERAKERASASRG